MVYITKGTWLKDSKVIIRVNEQTTNEEKKF